MTDEAIIAAMGRLGVTPEDLVRAQAAPQTLGSFQHTMKHRYRQMLREVHPDHGGDPEAFRALTAVIDDIMAMEVSRQSKTRRTFRWAMQIRMEAL